MSRRRRSCVARSFFWKEICHRAGCRRRQSEVTVRKRRCHAPARRALQEALLDQERLQHVLDRIALLADRSRQVVDADGAAGEFVEESPQQLTVTTLESRKVHVEHRERVYRDL